MTQAAAGKASPKTGTSGSGLLVLLFAAFLVVLQTRLPADAQIGNLQNLLQNPGAAVHKIEKNGSAKAQVQGVVLSKNLASCRPSYPDLPSGTATVFTDAHPRAQWLQVATAARKAGIHGDCLAVAIATSRAESSFNYEARNYNGNSSCQYNMSAWHDAGCKVDMGWWQINSYYHTDVTPQCADDLNCAARWVAAYTNGGRSGWTAWCTTGVDSCGGAGQDYIGKYVPMARAAALAVGG